MSSANTVQHYLSALRDTPDQDHEILIGGLITSGCDVGEVLAACLLLPLAFGRALLAGMGIHFSDEFMQLDENGHILGEEKLSENRIFKQAVEEVGRHPGLMDLLAKKSSEVSAVNHAIEAGSNLADLVMAPVLMFSGLPTEEGSERARLLLNDRAKRRASEIAEERSGKDE